MKRILTIIPVMPGFSLPIIAQKNKQLLPVNPAVKTGTPDGKGFIFP
ncbi:MAG: hypothetical protein AAB212_05175 [Bacteroidota bacterium]